MMPLPTVPTFSELSRAEAEALLGRNHVGRLAFRFRDRLDIQPIHYVYADGVINCRTATGTKLETLRHQHAVAFEVDEVEGLFDWRSAVAHGVAYVAEPSGSASDLRAYHDAVENLRSLLPDTFRAGDPAAFRSTIIRIHVDDVTGRAASTGAA
jgi:uncharacterized protein